jgi:hypothetical protein
MSTAKELVELIARMRLSTEGDNPTLAEEITGEDDAGMTLDELIFSARQIVATPAAANGTHAISLTTEEVVMLSRTLRFAASQLGKSIDHKDCGDPILDLGLKIITQARVTIP